MPLKGPRRDFMDLLERLLPVETPEWVVTLELKPMVAPCLARDGMRQNVASPCPRENDAGLRYGRLGET